MTTDAQRKRFRNFGSDDVARDPISFELYGEEFHCRTALQGKVLLEIIANMDANDSGYVAQTISKFFEYTLLPESYERFDALLHHPDKIVSVETLGEITAWLVEEYTQRPTQRPEPS
jgi:hypothetical protein